MIPEEKPIDVLAEVAAQLKRIADALEDLNNAAVRSDCDTGSHVEIFTVTHPG